MFKKKEFTLQDWELLEAQKNEQLRNVRESIETLIAGRPAILLRMAEEDQAAFAELKENDMSIVRLKTEAESIEMLLKTIPARKAYARGVAIEALIPQIKKLDDKFPTLVADIEEKAAALFTASRNLDDYLQKFDEIDATRSLNLHSTLWRASIAAILNVFSPASDYDSRPINNDLIRARLVLDGENFSALIADMRKSVADQVARMRETARRLKGETEETADPTYCPSCYSTDIHWSGIENKYTCQSCNNKF